MLTPLVTKSLSNSSPITFVHWYLQAIYPGHYNAAFKALSKAAPTRNQLKKDIQKC